MRPLASKVLLVEDSLPMRDVLTDILRALPGLELVAVAATAGDALVQFAQHQPDIVILDLVLKTGSGLDVLRGIKQLAPACQVLVFTSHDEAPYRASCLGEKADYFFSKNSQHRELVQLLHTLGPREGVGPNHGAGRPLDVHRTPAARP